MYLLHGFKHKVEALVARLKHEEQQNTTLTARLASVEQQLSKTAQEIETERTAREHLLSTMQLEAATAAVETATKVCTKVPLMVSLPSSLYLAQFRRVIAHGPFFQTFSTFSERSNSFFLRREKKK